MLVTKENSLVTNVSVAANWDNLTHFKHKNVTLLATHDTEKISLTMIDSSGSYSNKEIAFEKNTCEDNRNFIQKVIFIFFLILL